jgi:hypothetical protein
MRRGAGGEVEWRHMNTTQQQHLGLLSTHQQVLQQPLARLGSRLGSIMMSSPAQSEDTIT